MPHYINAIVDKSVLHGLSAREAKWLFHHFSINLPPVLFAEVLADLAKSKGLVTGTPDGDVRMLSKKITSYSVYTNAAHHALIAGELMGSPVEMSHRPVVSNAKSARMPDGSIGVYLDQTPFQEVMDRWVAGDFDGMEREFAKDLGLIERHMDKLVPIIGGLDDARYNLDGFFGHSNNHYALVFRNGCIEAVQAYGDQGERPTLPALNLEREIMRHIKGAKSLLTELGVEPPIAVGCSVVGAKGYELTQNYGSTHAIDREAVILPDEVLTTFARPFQADARPIIEMLWQSVGVPRSPNFDQEGNYNPQQ